MKGGRVFYVYLVCRCSFLKTAKFDSGRRQSNSNRTDTPDTQESESFDDINKANTKTAEITEQHKHFEKAEMHAQKVLKKTKQKKTKKQRLQITTPPRFFAILLPCPCPVSPPNLHECVYGGGGELRSLNT